MNSLLIRSLAVPCFSFDVNGEKQMVYSRATVSRTIAPPPLPCVCARVRAHMRLFVRVHVLTGAL